LSRPVCLLALVVLSLVAAAPAAAHVTATPSFLGAGDTGTLDLEAPNERDAAMSGFAVTVPPELSIVAASRASNGWEGTIRGTTASWSGCCVAAGQAATFPLEVTAVGEPGAVELEARQLYHGGEHATWQVALTIVPGTPSSGGSNGWALLMVFLSIVAVSAAIAVARARKARSFEE
jgi:hypothetical protein